VAVVLGAAVLVAIPLSTSPLEEACRLGVVSKVVIDGYDKSRDLAAYVVLELAASVGTALLVVAFWSARSGGPAIEPSTPVAASVVPAPVAARGKSSWRSGRAIDFFWV